MCLPSGHGAVSAPWSQRKPDMHDFLFFWGPDARRLGYQKAVLSQWYPSPFYDEGNLYCNAEQYMMHRKALLFEDDAVAADIMKTRQPAAMKRKGRAVKNFDPKVWDAEKVSIVRSGNLLKF